MHESNAFMFNAGRIAMPLFCFVLSYNLARPGATERGVFKRVCKRLVIFGVVSTVPFIALGGLLSGWWPLNIMFALALSTACIYLISQGGSGKIALAVILFLVCGAFVEYWWFILLMSIFAYKYCKDQNPAYLIFWVFFTALLYVINKNFWALASFPLIFSLRHYQIKVPRLKMFFYAYYPVHLSLILIIVRYIQK